MKATLLIIISLISGVWCNAQTQTDNFNYNDWIKRDTDLVTGDVSVEGKKSIPLTDSTESILSISLFIPPKHPNGFVIIMQLLISNDPNNKCIEDNPKINILFTDKTRREITCNNKFNCKGNAAIYFDDVFGHLDDLKLLEEKKVKIIRINTSSGNVQKELSDANAVLLMNEFKALCLVPSPISLSKTESQETKTSQSQTIVLNETDIGPLTCKYQKDINAHDTLLYALISFRDLTYEVLTEYGLCLIPKSDIYDFIKNLKEADAKMDEDNIELSWHSDSYLLILKDNKLYLFEPSSTGQAFNKINKNKVEKLIAWFDSIGFK